MNMKLAAKILSKVGLVGFIGFVATFTIYMFSTGRQADLLRGASVPEQALRRSRCATSVSSELPTKQIQPRCFGSGFYACVIDTHSNENRFAGSCWKGLRRGLLLRCLMPFPVCTRLWAGGS